jgi:hypothetical protein
LPPTINPVDSFAAHTGQRQAQCVDPRRRLAQLQRVGHQPHLRTHQAQRGEQHIAADQVTQRTHPLLRHRQ